MRSLLVAVVLAIALASAAGAGATEKVRAFEDGGEGIFCYPCPGYLNEFAVMDSICGLPGATAGYVTGTITPKTTVRVVNRNITRRNLDLLSGKRVVVFGKFKMIGEGEGSRVYCLSLTIFVLPESSLAYHW